MLRGYTRLSLRTFPKNKKNWKNKRNKYEIPKWNKKKKEK